LCYIGNAQNICSVKRSGKLAPHAYHYTHIKAGIWMPVARRTINAVLITLSMNYFIMAFLITIPQITKILLSLAALFIIAAVILCRVRQQ
jgi:hypothetical protein